MHLPSPDQKTRAQSAANLAVPASLWSGFLAVAVGGGFVVAVPVLPVVGFGLSVWYAALAVGLGHFGYRMTGVASDPPDQQYNVSAQLGPPLFDLEVLRADDEFGELSASALFELLEAARHAAAMVRAIERSQGAALASSRDVEASRLAEAETYAQDLGQHLVRFAANARPVAEANRRLPDYDWSQVTGGRLPDLLPSEVLSDLYLAGVPLGSLNIPIMESPTEDPRAAFSRELDALADTSEAYGTRLIESPSSSFT